jgi:dipeptidyl-peptidase 4
VTDQRLYDTHYTERYLGHPDEEPDVYRRNSLLEDAPKLERPMMIIHGLADDNVVVAHSLRLSRALLEAGRPHVFLPLSGITHMAAEEVVAENLLVLQVRFLRDALGLDEDGAGGTSLRTGSPTPSDPV